MSLMSNIIRDVGGDSEVWNQAAGNYIIIEMKN